MEFYKPSYEKEKDKKTFGLMPPVIFFAALVFGFLELYVKRVLGFHFSIAISILSSLLLLAAGIAAAIFGVMHLDIKVILDDGKMKYFRRSIGGYKLLHSIDISDIASIRRRSLEVSFQKNYFKRYDAKTTLYYVIDKKGKRRFLLQEVNIDTESLKNGDNVSILEFLENNYNIYVQVDPIMDGVDMLKGIGIGSVVVAAFVGFLVLVVKLLAG